MPEISRLSGVIITMYYNDHHPPHFHVRDSGQKAIITIIPQKIKISREIIENVKNIKNCFKKNPQFFYSKRMFVKS